MREKLDQMQQLAVQHQQDSHKQTKHHYDQKAKERTFEPGDQVLVLMPMASGKLSAQWQGPYSIVQQVSPVTYTIDMYDRRKWKPTVHLNMLKQWNSPGCISLYSGIPQLHQSLHSAEPNRG